MSDGNPEALGQLAADTVDAARTRRRVPTATYRLQMHHAFTIRDALALVPYLGALGISHVYTSSLLTARPGSLHGYDVIDHGHLNPELGTEADLVEWTDSLHARGMGLILDVVPNHMCVNGPNTWWADVLEHGPSSPFAGHFDIAWNDHPREALRGKVLLPILGEMYGKTLESGYFKPDYEGGAFCFQLPHTRLPIDPRTYGRVLHPTLDEARVRLGAASEAVLELQSILSAVSHLPSRAEPDPATIREGRYEITVVKRRLADLTRRNPAVETLLRQSLGRLAGSVGSPASFTALDDWLVAQAYRPAFWRVASDEINYRRFFDVNDLAAISTEREEVFLATHGKILEWLAAGIVDGLRVDHPDGLYDPRQYLDRLQAHYLLALARRRLESESRSYGDLTWADAAGPLAERLAPAVSENFLYVVVEKILGPGEKLPADWQTQGTTGYEFLVAVNGLFVDGANEAAMTTEYERFTGLTAPYDELVYRNKFLILQSALAGELHVLAHQLDRLAQMERGSRDFTLNTLRHALRECIACFPVYRSYVTDEGVADSDRALIVRAAVRARRRNPLLGRRVFDFIRDTLLLKEPPSGWPTEAYRAAQRSFAGKFQQVTSPVMAKGLEDTTFYVYNRMVSLNEVGGEPGRFGAGIAATHAAFAERAARTPHALSPLATHDTKRGEDVRARLNMLSQIPGEWANRVTRWAGWNRHHKIELEDGPAPDANEEYLLYQTLVGTWPTPATPSRDGRTYLTRLQEYMNKAVHEAKVHTSWINPDPDYDAAIGEFAARLLGPLRTAEFLDDLREFCAKLQPSASFNALAQTLLRCTAPGVPDTYQGTETWDDSLVDPDNRRPVDYRQAARWLGELDATAGGKPPSFDPSDPTDAGRAKLFVVSRALRLRRAHPEIFRGTYVSIDAVGPRGEHVFAFLRSDGAKTVLAAVPRLTHAMPTDGPWGDTVLRLPEELTGRTWQSVLTGESHSLHSAEWPVAHLFASFPVALWITT